MIIKRHSSRWECLIESTAVLGRLLLFALVSTSSHIPLSGCMPISLPICFPILSQPESAEKSWRGEDGKAAGQSDGEGQCRRELPALPAVIKAKEFIIAGRS